MHRQIRQWLLLGGQALLLFYLGWSTQPKELPGTVALTAAVLLLLDGSYISIRNLRRNPVLDLFALLLTLDSWYLLLAYGTSPWETLAFDALSPILGYASLRFLLLFLFQGGGYRFQRVIEGLLGIACGAALAGLLISPRVYAGLYGLQFLLNGLCGLFVLCFHWERVAFVLKSEGRRLLTSAGILAAVGLIYYALTLNIPRHIENFGLYIMVLLFWASIHSILAGGQTSELDHLRREEALKTDFANFLHDEVLQDLLSIKNMIAKAHRPDIQDLIAETLDALNVRIRKRMQDDRPILPKSLTPKEHYQNLLEELAQSYPQRDLTVEFRCSDTLFLVEPYQVLLYRILKELLTNVYRHSDGGHAWIDLRQEKGLIRLTVRDDGSASPERLLSADRTRHKGLASIQDQLRQQEGTLEIIGAVPQGIQVRLTLPMKGDVSYQHFIGR